MGDLNYVYAVARIRVREKSLLTDADVSQMAGMKDEKEVLHFLADRGWGSGGNADEGADEMLAAEEEKISALMRELKVDPGIFRVLSYPQMYHNLKAAIKEACISDAPAHLFYELDACGEEEMKRVIREKDFRSLPAHMQKAAEEAYGIMLKTRDGQRCDVIVDRACLDAMEEAARKAKNSLLSEYEESSVAVADIRIAARALRTGKDLRFLKEALAPCRSFDTDALAAAAAKDMGALSEFLSGSGFSEAAAALKESSSAFERWCDNRLIDTIRPQKTNSVSAGPIVAYYLGRENEIRTARIILTAKANGFSEESTRERVRKMYG